VAEANVPRSLARGAGLWRGDAFPDSRDAVLPGRVLAGRLFLGFGNGAERFGMHAAVVLG